MVESVATAELVRTAAARRTDGPPLVDRLAAAIQSTVLSGAVPVGTRLRQKALAEQFGVSRTPVREALRKLQAIGLVELDAEPRRGCPRAVCA